MAAPTPTERINELSTIVAQVQTAIDAVRAEVKGLAGEHAKGADSLRELRTGFAIVEDRVLEIKAWKGSIGTLDEIKVQIALLQREVKDLKKWQDDSKQAEKDFHTKVWMIVPPVIASVLTAILMGSITFFINWYFHRVGP